MLHVHRTTSGACRFSCFRAAAHQPCLQKAALYACPITTLGTQQTVLSTTRSLLNTPR